MFALIENSTIIDIRGSLPRAARNAQGAWVCPPDGEWATAQHEACGWFEVVDTPRPEDTLTSTFGGEVQLVDGAPVFVWTQRDKTDEELAAEAAHAAAEQKAVEDAAILDAIRTTATPPTDGGAWVQPLGAHDAYPTGATVTHNGKTWVNLTPFNVWEPGVSGWREEVAVGYPEWVRPTGGHDAYQAGDRVAFNGSNYESTINGNVWSPTEYPAGWTLLT